MKIKKLHINISLLVLILSFIIASAKYPSFNPHNKLETPMASAGEITIVTPENKIYTEPMSGYYPGTYNFDNELPTTYGTNTKFLDEYHGSSNYNWIRTAPVWQGHYNVLDMYDGQGGLNTWGVHYFGEPQSSGTIEFHLIFTGRHATATRRHYLNFRASDNTIGFSVMLELHDGDIMYYNGSSWNEIITALDMVWYHHSVSFDCNAGINGQFNWIISDEQGNEIGRVENLEFENNLSTLGEIYMGTLVGDYGGGSLWDAFSFSWDPDYNIGDNKFEGLLLSYDTAEDLNWKGYSLDGQPNKTILGNTTITMPTDGVHSVQVFGNDSLGTMYESNTRYFTVSTSAPQLTINSPVFGEIYGAAAPTYDLLITIPYEAIWYTIDGGATNITASGLTGTIAQAEWDKLTDGIVTITFYANNSAGMIGSAEIMVVKYVTDEESPPEITINSPSENEFFGSNAPDYNISIIGFYDTLWYTLDNGATNITASGLTGTIDQTEWDKLTDGIVTITFYTNNSGGLIGNAEVMVVKHVTEGIPPGIPGYNLIALIGVTLAVTLLLAKRKLKN